MAAPITAKAWSISPNNRRAYVSLLDLLGWWAYTNKTRLLAANWTLVWSCDGATGPSDASDHTDRIASSANFATRATVAAAAQSYFVVENPDGVQLLFAYQGATDDVARVSYSAEGLFTLAGTTTQQPTATDEIVLSGATSIVGTSLGEDRVMSIWTADDGTGWRCPVFGSSAIRSCLSIDKVTRIAPSSTFVVPYALGNFVRMSREYLNESANLTTPTYMEILLTTLPGAENFRGWLGRVFTGGVSRQCRMYGQFTLICGDNSTANSNTLGNGGIIAVTQATCCASMGGTGALCWPIHLVGEQTAGLDGPWGTLIDWHQVITTSLTNPGIADTMPGYEVGDVPGVSGGQTGVGDVRTNWWVALGAGALWPWKNAAAAMEIV